MFWILGTETLFSALPLSFMTVARYEIDANTHSNCTAARKCICPTLEFSTRI